MNRKFKDLDYSSLLDQLAQHTAAYTKLLTENAASRDKEECRKLIQRLLAEINIRVSERDTKDPADRVVS